MVRSVLNQVGKRRFLGAALAATAALALGRGLSLHAAEPQPQLARPARPNIVVILADDMGYSDIGCYGGEVRTPNLDRLAAGGIRFTQCYNMARCCPSRTCLLTGLYPHEAGVGNMVRDHNLPAYRGFLNERCVTIAEVLKQSGYVTLMSGKWHVGEQRPHWPCDRGFDQYYGLIGGAANYWNPGEEKLARNDQFVKAEGDDFYLTDAFTTNAVQFLDQHGRGSNPFFLYLAYTAPHWPLQARPEDNRKYEDLYKKGWDELRQARYQRMLDMGIVQSRWGLSPSDAPKWQTVQNKDEMSHRMAVYAAQVDRLDQGVGKVIDKLKEIGAEKNTIIFFLADNGGCAEVVERSKPGIAAGGPDSFLSYTKSWANVSNTPFRRYKSQVHEGGIATPLIAYWPAGIPASGSLNHEVVHEMDLMPTCLELARAQYPKTFRDTPLLPLEGRSLAPAFRGQPMQDRGVLYWEHIGDRAVRAGKWKLVAYRETGPWELYDIEADRAESNDLASSLPDKVSELTTLYEKWAQRCGVVPFSKLPNKLTSKPVMD